MNNNRKLLVYGSVCVVFLIVVITIFLFKLFSPHKNGTIGELSGDISLFKAVPSDAVLVLDIEELDRLNPLLNDTASFARGMLDSKNAVVRFQKKLLTYSGIEKSPAVYSLHYSSKNEVSFLCIVDGSGIKESEGDLESLLASLSAKKKKYNRTDIYAIGDSLYAACYDHLIIMSSSSYVLESSVRHLDNETSILDNSDFKTLLYATAAENGLYVNHHQIGKLFSGVMERPFLKYSDFFLRFASWSNFTLEGKKGQLRLKGSLLNHNEEKYQSFVFSGQLSGKSTMGKILPAGTVFAVNIPLSNVGEYLNAYRLFLEVHKKRAGYTYKQQIVKGENEVSPQQYIDSLNIEELTAAYCKFGDRYEWITFVKEKSSFGITDMVSSVIDRKKTVEVLPYTYPGYIAAVFGEAFSHCNEQAYCKIDGWQVIGPKEVIEGFAVGEANYFNLDQYLSQTPAADFLGDEGVVKIVVNLKEARDNVLQIIKPYYKRLLEANLDKNNFEYLTVNITNQEPRIGVDVHFYATMLDELPKAKEREKRAGVALVDSTIVIPQGPFELKDFTTGGKCYLEQLGNNKLRMLDGKRKGVWTVPFETPLCGAVAQVDFFKNGKLQMLFVSGNRLYLLDRLGRMVKGFPVTLPARVTYGPEIADLANDKNYSVLVLNEDNSVSVYKLTRDKIAGGVKIKAPELVKKLPEVKRINGKNYLFLRSVLQTRIYTIDGKEISGKEKKRAISNESDITLIGGDEIKVTGVDGKEFIFNLVNGKTRKV